MDWAAIGGISGDKLTGRIDDVETRLGAKIDVLTERYISHLEHQPR